MRVWIVGSAMVMMAGLTTGAVMLPALVKPDPAAELVGASYGSDGRLHLNGRDNILPVSREYAGEIGRYHRVGRRGLADDYHYTPQP